MSAVSRRSAGVISRLAGLSPRRRVLVLGCVLGTASLVALGAVRLADGGGDAARADRLVPTQAEAGPVVLVPGYGGGARTLDVLAGQISASGRQVSVVRLPAAGTGDLHEQAAVVDEYVSDAIRQGAPSVDLRLEHREKDLLAIDPWPFGVAKIQLQVAGTRVPTTPFADVEAFRATYAEAPIEMVTLRFARA